MKEVLKLPNIHWNPLNNPSGLKATTLDLLSAYHNWIFRLGAFGTKGSRRWKII